GSALLPDDARQSRFELWFSLQFHRAECEFLSGELDAAETRLTLLSSCARRTTDRARVACLQSDLYTTLDRVDRAVEVCLDYLRELGIEWSPHPTPAEARGEYERTLALLGGRAIEDLADLPLMSSPESSGTLEVLARSMSAAVGTDANLLALLLWRIVSFS